MNKTELISRLCYIYPYVGQANIAIVVDLFFAAIVKTLQNGGKVELRGFGSFGVKKRRAIVGRNPRTGQSVNVPERIMPFFKAGIQLNQLLNKN